MKKLFIFISMMLLSVYTYAGRMPESIESLKAIGNGYIKLNIAESSSDAVYDYQIVHAADIRRLVGSSNSKICYMFYFTGMELLKIQVTNQSCENLTKELIAAQN
jgi:hypothetical protein